MVKRLLIVIFLMTQPVAAECKYYAEADVVNDVLVNKKEHYTCLLYTSPSPRDNR